MSVPTQIGDVADCFAIAGERVGVEPLGRGHINDTYILSYVAAGAPRRYLLQRLNTQIFKTPAHVMENIERVTTHLAAKLAADGITDARRVLTLVATVGGAPLHIADDGSCWRVYEFIEDAAVSDVVTAPEQAYATAYAFGEFQCLVADLPGPRLYETIPDFHNTPLRFEVFERVLREDRHERAASVQSEIDRVQARREAAGRLLALHRAGAAPERVVHNDCKINNVLLDAQTGAGLCVVDLDTIMPGLSLFDLGDMIRTMSTTAAEDETDLSRVEASPAFVAALVEGYLAATGDMLAPAERGNLLTAGEVITLEQAVRFLTDYLAGDVYYKTSHPDHNRDRCRAQLKLLDSLERQRANLRAR